MEYPLPWLSTLVPPREFDLIKKVFQPGGTEKGMPSEAVQEMLCELAGKTELKLTTTVKLLSNLRSAQCVIMFFFGDPW